MTNQNGTNEVGKIEKLESISNLKFLVGKMSGQLERRLGSWKAVLSVGKKSCQLERSLGSWEGGLVFGIWYFKYYGQALTIRVRE